MIGYRATIEMARNATKGHVGQYRSFAEDYPFLLMVVYELLDIGAGPLSEMAIEQWRDVTSNGCEL
jgi:hypothetical protein